MIPMPSIFCCFVDRQDTGLYLTPFITAHYSPSTHVPSLQSSFLDCITSCTARITHPLHLHIHCFLQPLAHFPHLLRAFHSLSCITLVRTPFIRGILLIHTAVGSPEQLCISSFLYLHSPFILVHLSINCPFSLSPLALSAHPFSLYRSTPSSLISYPTIETMYHYLSRQVSYPLKFIINRVPPALGWSSGRPCRNDVQHASLVQEKFRRCEQIYLEVLAVCI